MSEAEATPAQTQPDAEGVAADTPPETTDSQTAEQAGAGTGEDSGGDRTAEPEAAHNDNEGTGAKTEEQGGGGESPKPLYSDPEDDGHVEGVGFEPQDADDDFDEEERPSTAQERARRIANQLEEIDEQARARHEQGKHLEALSYMEQAMLLRKKFYGVGSPEMEKNCTALVTDYNTVAMKILNEGQSGEARKLLAKAEKVTEPNGPFVNQHTRMKLRAVSFNNLGCYYKQLGKYHLALQYLKKADHIESRTPAAHNRAGTHLNLCAVLSQLGKHEVALRHAIAALEMLGNPNKSATSSGKSELGIVAIAYHNLAVELECLKDYDSAKAAYLRALEVAKEDLGEDDPVTKKLQKAYSDAEKRAT
eukprot:TRINITY_DN872_c0_g1_i2.p1 TRINITY_DN872_c0_g1~~TRINITY_DN872_c0_g1_i2.p1  ORF type:complete len:364 (+),score=73.39 TRINITY_DN872_c0_g1_i2:301-1392(+)